MQLTGKEVLMMYQSTFRNVGLFTSLSLALLTLSRFYRNKGNKLYNIAFIIITMISLTVSLHFVSYMQKDNKKYYEMLSESEKKIISKWLKIPKYVEYMLYSILGFSGYTLFRQLKS